MEDAKCGTYVEPENPNAFKESILFYFKNQNLLKKEGENGYQYAYEYFDRDILAKKYISILSDLKSQ